MPLHDHAVDLEVEGRNRAVERVHFPVRILAAARHTGRDREATLHELELRRSRGARGLPLSGPSFCFLTRNLLVIADAIEVLGYSTAGEAEWVVFKRGAEILIGLGSDHCDRAIDREWADKTKQLCEHVVARRAWRYQDIRDHWDALILRSWVTKGGQRMLHQDGSVSTMLTVEDLLAADERVRQDGIVLFGGTIGSLPGTEVYEDAFEMELHDPVLDRSIRHGYTVHPLPDDSSWRGY